MKPFAKSIRCKEMLPRRTGPYNFRSVRIVSLLLCLFLMVSLTGCNRAESASDCIMRFQDAMNRQDFREAFVYVADYDGFGFSSDGSEDIMACVAKTLDIQVLSETPMSNGSNVEVSITTIDLREAYCDAANAVIPGYYKQAVSGQPISEAELGRRLVDEVVSLAKNGKSAGVTTKCILFVRKSDRGKWEIVLDTASYSAITGYIDEANNLITTGAIAAKVYGVHVDGIVSESDVSSGDANAAQ